MMNDAAADSLADPEVPAGPPSPTPSRRLLRLARRILLMTGLILVGFLASLYALQARMIFPGSSTQGRPEAVVHAEPGEELLRLPSPGGEVAALFSPARSADGSPLADAADRPTLVFFYGNAMCLSYTISEIDRFRRLGINVIVPDYLGYGMSGGKPSEVGCRQAAEACYAFLKSRGFPPDRIFVGGWSLGGAVAIDLASRERVGGVFALSTFTSTCDMARTFFPLAPPPDSSRTGSIAWRRSRRSNARSSWATAGETNSSHSRCSSAYPRPAPPPRPRSSSTGPITTTSSTKVVGPSIGPCSNSFQCASPGKQDKGSYVVESSPDPHAVALANRTEPPMEDSGEDVTRILEKLHDGDGDARRQLVEQFYREFRAMAVNLMKGERAGHTLQPTALVNEAMLRVLGDTVIDRADDRRLLFASVANVMREVLVDHARKRRTQKRGGGRNRVALDAVLESFEERNIDVLALHDALQGLSAFSPRQSEVVSLRFFGGLTMPEIAEQLGCSLSTVEADFRTARAWLHSVLASDAP